MTKWRGLLLRPLRDLLPYRGQLGFVPDADQDAAFDLKLVVRVGRDLFAARGDVVVRMQRPVEQCRLQPRNCVGAGWVFAAIRELLRIAIEIIEHRPEAGGVYVFPAA